MPTAEHYTLAMMKFLQRPAFVKVVMKINPTIAESGDQPSFRHIRLAPSEHLAAAGSPGHRHRHLWGDWPDHFPSPHVLKVEPPTIPTSSTPGSQADLLISSTRRGDGMSAGSPKRPAMPARLVPLQTEVLQVG